MPCATRSRTSRSRWLSWAELAERWRRVSVRWRPPAELLDESPDDRRSEHRLAKGRGSYCRR
jgi:hypothetical protein